MDAAFEAEDLLKVETTEGDAEGTSAFLGRGSFGWVFLCYDAKFMGRHVAVKQIHRYSGLEREKQTELVQKEIVTMLELRGRDNMVSLLRHVETPACFLLVTEYCNGGNLRTYLKRHCLDGGLPETTIRHFFRQIAVGLRGLVGLHGQILHRDLKPENVLLCHSYACEDPPPCDIIVKLADFGGARILSYASEPFTISVGTPQYWAPEIEREARKRASDRRSKSGVMQQAYSRKVDLYSVGVMMYECLTGALPFEGYNPERHDVTPDGGSANIGNLIEGLLKVDPQLRMDHENFYAHSFFKDIMSCSLSVNGVTLLLVESDTVIMVKSPLALRVCPVYSGSFVTEKVAAVLTLGPWHCPVIPGETIAVEFFTGHFVLFVLWTYRKGTSAVIWIPAELVHLYRSFREAIDEWVLVSRRDPPSRRRINPAMIEAHFNDVIGPAANYRPQESTDVANGAYERFADNFTFLPDGLSHSWRERKPVILTRRYRSMSEALEAQLPEHLLVVSDSNRRDKRGDSDSFWTKDRPDVSIPRRMLERSSYLEIGNANNRFRQLSADMVSVLCGHSDLPAIVDVPSTGVARKQLEQATDTVLNRFMHGPVEVFSLWGVL